jgi:hypothetical protein
VHHAVITSETGLLVTSRRAGRPKAGC